MCNDIHWNIFLITSLMFVHFLKFALTRIPVVVNVGGKQNDADSF